MTLVRIDIVMKSTWRREDKLFKIIHLSGATSGSDNALGSSDDRLADSYPDEVTLLVRKSSSTTDVELPGRELPLAAGKIKTKIFRILVVDVVVIV